MMISESSSMPHEDSRVRTARQCNGATNATTTRSLPGACGPSLLSSSRPLYLDEPERHLGHTYQEHPSIPIRTSEEYTQSSCPSYDLAPSPSVESPDSFYTSATEESDFRARRRHWSFDDPFCEEKRHQRLGWLAMDFAQATSSAYASGSATHLGTHQSQDQSASEVMESLPRYLDAAGKIVSTADVTTAQLEEMAPYLRVPALQEQLDLAGNSTNASQYGQSTPLEYSHYASSLRSESSSVSGYSILSGAESLYSQGSMSRTSSHTHLDRIGSTQRRIQVQTLSADIGDSSQRSATDASSVASSLDGRAKPAKSHSRRKPDGYIKRPLNAFFLFRRHVSSNNLIPKTVAVSDQRAISRIIACMWQNLPSDWQDEWRKEYHRERESFHAAHPEYKYKPESRSAKKKVHRKLKDEPCSQEQCREIADAIFMSYDAPKDVVAKSKKAKKPKKPTKVSEDPTSKPARRKRSSKKSIKEIENLKAPRPSKRRTTKQTTSDEPVAQSKEFARKRKAIASRNMSKGNSVAREDISFFSEKIAVPDEPADTSQGTIVAPKKRSPKDAGEELQDEQMRDVSRDPDTGQIETEDSSSSLRIEDWGVELSQEALSAASSNLAISAIAKPLPSARLFNNASPDAPSSSQVSGREKSTQAASTLLKRRKLPPPQLQLAQSKAVQMPRPSPRTLSFSGLPTSRRLLNTLHAERTPTANLMEKEARPHTMATPRDAIFKDWPQSTLSSMLLSPSTNSSLDMRRTMAGPASALFGSFGKKPHDAENVKDVHQADHAAGINVSQGVISGSGGGWTPLRSLFGLESAGLTGAFPRIRRMSFSERRRASMTMDTGILDASLGLSPRAVAQDMFEPLTARPGASFFTHNPETLSSDTHAVASSLAASLGELVSPTSASLSLHGSVPEFDFSVPTPSSSLGLHSASTSSSRSTRAHPSDKNTRKSVSTHLKNLPPFTQSQTLPDGEPSACGQPKNQSAPAAATRSGLFTAQQRRKPEDQEDDASDVFHFSPDFLETAQQGLPTLPCPRAASMPRDL